MDTIFLIKNCVDLEEVVIINNGGFLKSVNDNIQNNYYQTPTTENYFMRYFVKQDSTKTQMTESILSVYKNQYFGAKNERNYEMKIIANSNSLNNKEINKVEFVPFSYDKLYSYSDVQIDFQGKYDLKYEYLSKDQLKVSFSSTDSTILKSGPFTGYAIINISDKAIEEFYIQKKYSQGATEKKLKLGFSQEDIYFNNKRIWKKDSLNKYRLYLMEFNGQVKVSNIDFKVDDIYSYNIITQLIDDKTIPLSKKLIKTKIGKAINDYNELNKSLVLEILKSVILKTEEQSKVK